MNNKLIDELMTHHFRPYKFSKYIYGDVFKSKRRRIIQRSILRHYSTFRKRLLSRTFFLIEGYENKKYYCQIVEIERMLAGLDTKLIYSTLKRGYWGDPLLRGEKGEWLKMKVGNWNLSRYAYQVNNPHDVIKKTIHKYSCSEMYDQCLPHFNIFKYLMRFEKHPELELLAKSGLCMVYNDYASIRWKQKNFLDKLGVKRQSLRYLSIPGIDIKWLRKNEPALLDNKLTVDEAMLFRLDNKRSIKLIRYLVCQKQTSYHIYDDYMRFVDDLGLPLKNSIIYPNELITEHDKLLSKVSSKRAQIYKDKIKNYAKELASYDYEDNDYVIFPAETPDDLINESKVLDHCVRTYVESYAKRETSIFLIRKKTEVELPFFTLELKNNYIQQVCGKKHSLPEENLRQFIDRWAKTNKINNMKY